MKTILSSAPSAGLVTAAAPLSASPAQTSFVGASWQGYLAPASGSVSGADLGLRGISAMSGRAMSVGNVGGHVAPDALHAVAGVVAAAPLATAAAPLATASLGAMPSAAQTLAAAGTVAAVAGAHQVATAPKQAEKPNDTRNDVFPLGTRPGAPPS